MPIPTPEPGLVISYAYLWIVVAEGNDFLWPGYDLRKAPGTDRYDHGFLPPRFFNQVLAAFSRLRITGRARRTPRE